MIRFRRVLVAGLMMLLWPGAVTVASPLDEEAFPAPGQRIDVDGHRMHLYCAGQGAPAVILDAGLGGTSLDWVIVQPAVARFTRVCSYDRAGYGWSDRVPGPRTSAAIVGELHQLLKQAEIAPPYLVVGHSFGGLSMRLFASRYPDEVTGMVLIDPTHEDQFERLTRAELGRALVPSPGRRFVIANHWQIPAALPQELKVTAQALALTPDSISTLYSELEYMQVSAKQVRDVRARFPDVPLIVIAHDSWSQAQSPRARRMAMSWLQLQQELAARGRHSQLSIAGNSGHYVHLEQPDIVIGAIRNVMLQNVGR
jgi:pimeloyl-ACP methyl ester carboxylesterase